MGDGHRILVVDDELGPREALRMILKSKYQVMTAVNGPDALQCIARMPPDIVLLDITDRCMQNLTFGSEAGAGSAPFSRENLSWRCNARYVRYELENLVCQRTSFCEN
jgi:DNA-binding NarL/FixJ family response regulator